MEQENTERRPGRPKVDEQEIESAVGVRKVRLVLKMTQAQMANELLCSISSVARFERENALPGTGALRAQLDKLARKAGVTLEAE